MRSRKKFGIDRFNRFDVYRLQQTNRQTLKKSINIDKSVYSSYALRPFFLRVSYNNKFLGLKLYIFRYNKEK